MSGVTTTYALSGSTVLSQTTGNETLFFYYDEPKAYTVAYEYLLGRDILVAPVIKAKASKKEVYLPDDEWIHLWTGEEYGGGSHTVDSPVGQIPVFIRKQSSFKDEFLKLAEI